MELSQALKEWAVAVDALESGKTIMLLRKGGIREQGGSFNVAHDQVLLYPTYEHQQPQLLKSAYATQVAPVPSGWHPATVQISAWAQITHVFSVSAEPVVTALLPYHIWRAQFVSERFGWKPRQPLSVLLLRAHRLPQVQVIPYRSEYGGCQSWIALNQAIAIDHAIPVLGEAEYTQRVSEIQKVVEQT